MKTGRACLVHDPDHCTMGGLLIGLDEDLSLIVQHCRLCEVLRQVAAIYELLIEIELIVRGNDDP